MMNERIKELAEQAISNVRFWKAEKESYVVDQDELAKFAELIVRECIDAVENTNDRYRRDYFADKIRERFGVEK